MRLMNAACNHARRIRAHWLLALAFVLFPAPLFALITLAVESAPGSRPLTGSGLPVATMQFGTVSPFGPLEAGVSRSVGASDYTVSTNFGVRVTKLLSLSSSYTLRARLQLANPLMWKIDGTALSTGAATIATTQPYATLVPHTLALVVPFSHPAGVVSTIIEVTAIAN